MSNLQNSRYTCYIYQCSVLKHNIVKFVNMATVGNQHDRGRGADPVRPGLGERICVKSKTIFRALLFPSCLVRHQERPHDVVFASLPEMVQTICE